MNPTMENKAASSLPEPIGGAATAGSDSVKNKRSGTVVERPSTEKGSWERWHFTAGGVSEQLENDSPLPPRALRVTVLPSSTLFAWPLWISSEGDSSDLVRMELSGRHLLKRGMESSLSVLPVAHTDGRQLVLAVATDEPFPVEVMPPGWKKASRFEIPANLFGNKHGHDLILWEEWGMIQVAFYRAGKPVWFCGLRETDPGGTVHRSALRLLSEGVIERLPTSIAIKGMHRNVAEQCAAEFKKNFPQAVIHRDPYGSSSASTRTAPTMEPVLSEASLELLPSEARSDRLLRKNSARVASLAVAGGLLYLLLLLSGAADLLIRQTELTRIRREISGMENRTLQARKESSRWNALRPAVDPRTYPLDILAAVATPTESGKVRLTSFSLDHGRLQISGEATDVTQAYAFIEQLKKNPLLQEYDWTAGQPQLAGKNSVRFDMEGARPTPTHETTGP